MEDSSDETFTAAIPEPPRALIEPGISETLKNRRLRDARKPAWDTAGAVCRYWLTLRHFTSALIGVQRRELPEGASHPAATPDYEWKALAQWRLAIAAQLLTLAPDTRAVAWKRPCWPMVNGNGRMSPTPRSPAPFRRMNSSLRHTRREQSG
jgi:hypothetical protein